MSLSLGCDEFAQLAWAGMTAFPVCPDYTFVDTTDGMTQVIARLHNAELIALDCESVKLSRDHPVSILCAAFDEKDIFIVDVQSLGFPEGLKAVLEDPKITKVMYDCRSDADSLRHQHGISLDGVKDMQIMEYVVDHADLKAAEQLAPFVEVVGKYVGEEEKQCLRNIKPPSIFLKDWSKRPLKDPFLSYAALEISSFFPVFAKLVDRCPRTDSDILEWSSRYLRSRRDVDNFSYADPYQLHRYMPMGILEPIPAGNTPCKSCGIRLERSAFSKSQLNKHVQKCIVCKAVKFGLDVEKNRQDNFARDEANSSYNYYPSSPECSD